jgi:DNA-binding CsgD family transcriptional regulator
MLEGLSIIFGVVQAAGGEAWWHRPARTIQPVSAYSVSAEPAAHAAFIAYHRAAGPADDPIFQAIQKLPDKLVTRTRRQLVSDAAWYRSTAFEYRRSGGIGHVLTSIFQVSDSGATSSVALNRALGERDFSPREQRLLNFFHGELGRLIGGSLVSATEPSHEKLSRRLRQTLACLLEGDSEKQVAARLGLSHATTHQYVTALYRRFGVQSRAELLAYFIKRFDSRTVMVEATGARRIGYSIGLRVSGPACPISPWRLRDDGPHPDPAAVGRAA